MLKTKYKILIYNFIKKIFSLLGVDIKFKKNLSFDEIYQKYVRKKPIIIDVGANEGQSIERFSSIFNNCIIHSFEPINKCFDQMVKDFPGKNYYKNNYALSNKNTNRKFFINEQYNNYHHTCSCAAIFRCLQKSISSFTCSSYRAFRRLGFANCYLEYQFVLFQSNGFV